jgi:CAAX protease family protein
MEPTNPEPTSPSQQANPGLAGDPGEGLECATAAPAEGGWRVPYWHTAVLLIVMLVLSLANTNSGRAVHSGSSHLRIYLGTIVYEWLLTGYVWWGVRRSGGTLRQLIGGRWDDLGDFLLDIALAGAVWLGALIAVAMAAVAMGMGHGGSLDETRRQLEFLVPDSALEIVVWISLSATAGFCEELIFRGYLQNQFTHLLRSRWLALPLVSILFGLGHGYEGPKRMVLIALLGFCFGLMSIARKSLRPAMIAHTLQDTISGLLLRALR